MLLAAALALGGCSAFATRHPAAKPDSPTPVAAVPPAKRVSGDVRYVVRALTAAQASGYLGDAACAGCHPQASKEHWASRHARTLRRVTSKLDGPYFAGGNQVWDFKRGLVYHTATAGSRCLLTASDNQRSGAAPADYVLGTGRNALTYLSESDRNRYLKLRLTYYTRPKQWDYTPSELPGDPISGPPGVVETGIALEQCLACHVTVLRRDEDGLDLSHSQLGVGCERCHGPGSAHVKAASARRPAGSMEHLQTASPSEINTLCGECHHTSKTVDLQSPRTQENMPRFQGLALEQSACYQKSGRLSCVTCHSPHADASADLRSYDRICSSCHQPHSTQKACPVNTRGGCTNCHMPKQEIAGIPHTIYRTHLIRVWRKAGAATSPTPSSNAPTSTPEAGAAAGKLER